MPGDQSLVLHPPTLRHPGYIVNVGTLCHVPRCLLKGLLHHKERGKEINGWKEHNFMTTCLGVYRFELGVETISGVLWDPDGIARYCTVKKRKDLFGTGLSDKLMAPLLENLYLNVRNF